MLLNNTIITNSGKESMVRCSVCNKYFKSIKGLNLHIKKSHPFKKFW